MGFGEPLGAAELLQLWQLYKAMINGKYISKVVYSVSFSSDISFCMSSD